MVKQNNSLEELKESPQKDDKNLLSLAQYIKDAQQSHKRSIPPVDQWQPKRCGKMDLSVKANGEWWHEGQLIKRQSLLDLFSSVLWKENDQFYLKTPAEQIEIKVEDEPLFVNQVNQIKLNGKQYIELTTTNQDVVIVDEDHPIFMREYEGELRPYVHVRFGINALIQRQSFYHLVQYGELEENAEGKTILHLQSGDLHLQLGT
ncbi:DUF1285 domain-containing protein [Acinetobacter sp. UBA1297]|uniref:DUF1285 domain-containing protein n=1 Tax=Acinetobacter sp. UBA1297 TaxID=1945925 RepID=UPI00257FE33B|nr:DUF1285 domain-containing protein [Acinetobacter sp. UBA1297]